MADTIKCPNCSGNLKFNPDTQKLGCDFCGASFDPSLFDSKIDELVTDAPAAEAAPVAEAQPSGPAEQITTEVSEALGPSDEVKPGEHQSNVNEGEQVEFVCNSCGARVVTDKNTSATFCAFCGSPAMVGQRLTNEFRPQYMIPFKISRQKAENAFLKWAGGGKWTPFGFVSKENVKKLTGLYVPFWLFNIKAHIDVEGTAEDVSYSGDKQITSHYEIKRMGDVEWKNIPLDGETRIDDKLMEAIEPFNFANMIPYDYDYIPGFYADRYDQDAQALAKRATDRGIAGMDQVIKKSIGKKYDRHKITKNRSTITSMAANYALLPVWFMSYKYHNQMYYFAMNGQTGEVAGKVPVSKVKKTAFFFIVLAIAAVIARFALGIFMRGIWG
jgi:DNA-directed RNA polymerase subunit RPC12/RpoP